MSWLTIWFVVNEENHLKGRREREIATKLPISSFRSLVSSFFFLLFSFSFLNLVFLFVSVNFFEYQLMPEKHVLLCVCVCVSLFCLKICWIWFIWDLCLGQRVFSSSLTWIFTRYFDDFILSLCHHALISPFVLPEC